VATLRPLTWTSCPTPDRDPLAAGQGRGSSRSPQMAATTIRPSEIPPATQGKTRRLRTSTAGRKFVPGWPGEAGSTRQNRGSGFGGPGRSPARMSSTRWRGVRRSRTRNEVPARRTSAPAFTTAGHPDDFWGALLLRDQRRVWRQAPRRIASGWHDARLPISPFMCPPSTKNPRITGTAAADHIIPAGIERTQPPERGYGDGPTMRDCRHRSPRVPKSTVSPIPRSPRCSGSFSARARSADSDRAAGRTADFLEL
jgi:hypothetical protein